MTALAITAGNVVLVSGNPLVDQIAGEAFVAGKSVYQKSTDLKWYLAECDSSADAAGAINAGLALFTADVAGARGSVATADGNCVVAVGVGVAGTPYFIGAAFGAVVPFADLVTTNKSTQIATGIGSNKLKMVRIYDAGAVLP